MGRLWVKTVWCRPHVKVSFDQLVARSGLWQVFVFCYRQKRRMRSDNHEAILTVCREVNKNC
jgi:hypothetical protein